VSQTPREAVLGSLTMIVSDEQEDTDDRLAAAQLVLDATMPVPSQQDQDQALRQVGDQVAERVIEHLISRVELQPQ